MTASDGGLYKLLVIGGGPAGVGVFIRAARTGFLSRLLNPAAHGEARDMETSERVGMKQRGVAIVHDGDANTFGSGNLGNYVINSNTFARSLLSSVLDEKPDLDPPESIKGTFLERAKDHESTRKLEETGNAPACLVEFGRFLQNVGACLLKEFSMHADSSKCLLRTRATRFERLESGIYRVELMENDRVITLYSEHLVLAIGGRQELPTQLENNASYKAKSFLSEDCLREDGFARLRDHLLQCEGRKVCIVGGSHSSFSVAWMLLNKGKQQRAKSLVLPSSGKESLGEDPISTDICASALSSPAKSDAPRSPIATADSDAEIVADAPDPMGLSPLELLEVPTNPTETHPTPSVAKPKYQGLVFQPRDITILHRSPIRCYYSTRKDAEADGADGSRVDRTGCVNTFTGLREDSKHLFKDIKAGKECRVRLFQVNQNGCQNLTAKAYESANAIVWCCGYGTRMLPGFDEQGKPLKFHEDHGVVKLDLLARIQLVQPSKAVVPALNLYGVGLGFSLRSHVDEMGTETRADGVTVYHRRGATLVLAALFGPEVFGKDTQSFEEMVEKNDKNRKKKEPSANAVETSLSDRIKRTSSQNHSAAPSPLRTPSKAGASSSHIIGASTPPAGLPNAPCMAASLARISPEKPTMRRLSGKSSLAPAPNNPTGAAPVAAAGSPLATNPPVKMLLQRRRSTETLPAPGSATTRKSDARKPDVRAGSGSLSKAALLQSRSVRFAERRTEPQTSA